MNSFENTRNTLLSASKESRNYERALTEWEYRGTVYDSGETRAVCELCGQQNLRYSFEIVNKKNANILLVGSECITKFGAIKVYDFDGSQITGKKANARIAKDRRNLIADAKTKSVLNSLVTLANVDSEFDINSFIGYYQTRGAFTPKQLALLLWRFEKFQVSYKNAHLKLTLRRDREKIQLLSLPNWQLTKIEGCLSSSQRNWLDRNRRNE